MLMTDTNVNTGAKVSALGSPTSSVSGGLNLNLNHIETGYLSGGGGGGNNNNNSAAANQLFKERNTPKYNSSTQLDMTGAANANSKQGQSSMMKHRMAVQNSIKNSRGNNTPMGGGRMKRMSAYEAASDDESVLEFQNMENQLLKDGTTRKSNMHASSQQDAAQPVVGGFTATTQNMLGGNQSGNNGYTASKFKKNASGMKQESSTANNNNSKVQGNSGNSNSKMTLQQQQSKSNSGTTSNKSKSGTVNRKKSSNINQKQSQTKPIAKDQVEVLSQQDTKGIETAKKDQQNKGKAKSGGCCGIFCCGYCCSRGAGLSDKDKTQEMDLRPEQKPLPDIQEMDYQQDNYNNNKYGINDQDLSQIDDQEELNYNSVSQSQIDDNGEDYEQYGNANRNKVYGSEEQHLVTDSQMNSQLVIEEEMDDQFDMDEMGDEERIELDLRSDIKNPSGEHSQVHAGIHKSLKSSTDPMEMKHLNNNHDEDPAMADSIIQEEVDNSDINVRVSSQMEMDNSYDQDRRNLEKNKYNKNSQPRLVQDDNDTTQGKDNLNDDEMDKQYNQKPDPERRYSNDQFMRIEGPSPESQLLLPVGNMNPKQTSSNNGGGADDQNKDIEDIDASEEQYSQRSSNRNDLSAGYVDGAQRKSGLSSANSGGHQRIAGDEMQMDDDLDDEERNNDRHDSLQEIEESDKTIDNDQDQYKLAQAKRMYVIHEVDEDAFSERSSRRDKSKIMASTYEKPNSVYNDQQSNHNEYQNSLQALKEEPNDEEDVYGLNNMKHQQTLSMDNDLSSMQINASQDIEPHNISQSNTNFNQQQQILQQNRQKSPDSTSAKYNNQINNGGRDSSIKIIEDLSQDQINSAREGNVQINERNAKRNSAKDIIDQQKQQKLLMSDGEEEGDFQKYEKQSKSLINFQKYMDDEEAKQMQSRQGGQTADGQREGSSLTPKERSNPRQQNISSNISPINTNSQATPTPTNAGNAPNNVSAKNELKSEKQSFFRPQANQNARKGAGNQQMRPSDESVRQIQEEIVLIDDFTSSSPNKQSQQKVSKQSSSSSKDLKNIEQQQQQQQVIIQKIQLDKSKLSQTYYQSFDQFVIANNLNLDDQTKKASIQSTLQENDNPFEIKAGHQHEELAESKEQALKRFQQRQSQQEQQKHKQVLQVKEKALKKERVRLAKQQCAIKIQKLWKGHLQRKEYVDLRDNLRKVKSVRRMLDNNYSQFKDTLIKELTSGMKQAKANKDQQEQEMMNSFLNVCALQIQSNWRGHKYRKNHLPQIRKERQAEERFRAFVKGWKVRKVMQTREIFSMSQNIKDLTKVQEYFIYVEKSDNMLLLHQLKKDRKKAIQGYIELIDHLLTSGQWIKSYIGNKIVENEDQLDSTMDGLESNMKSPIKDFNLNDSQLRELVTTEKFLYDDDLEKNPYIFESDEFVRQKFLERRQRDYQRVDIEFIDQNGKNSGKQLSANQKSSRNRLKAVDDDSSRYDSESVHQNDKKKTQLKGGRQRDQSFDSDFRGSINPRDNQALPKNKKTFEQMLEDAMSHEKGSSLGSGKGNAKNSASKEFLKRKEKYDPQKSLKNKKGEINNKNIEKKRVFKSKNRMGTESDEENSFEQDNDMLSDGGMQSETRGTFKHFPRKSFIQLENEPMPTNKTALPPSLLQKFYLEQLKVQKFLRTDTGRQIGSNPQKYVPLNKNQQVYPSMPLPEEKQQLSLQVEELESIFQVYHGGQDSNIFLKSKDIKRDKDSKIPTLKEKSLFYKYYDDKVYDSKLDDIQKEFHKSTKTQKKYMYGAQTLY